MTQTISILKKGLGWRRNWMLLGFIAAFVGDWLLAIKASPTASDGFMWGVVAFTCAHVFWTMGQLREVRPLPRALVTLGVPLVVFSGVRLAPLVPEATAAELCLYSLTTALSMSTALATRRRWYLWGIWLLALSDVFIGERMLGATLIGYLVGPFYVAAEVCLLVSFFKREEHRMELQPRNVHGVALTWGPLCLVCFLLGMVSFPGGGYNPCMQMLSTLGRVVIHGVDWPFCHFAFTAGMVLAALAVTRIGMVMQDKLPAVWRQRLFGWGIAINAAGLLTVAAVPEDVDITYHNTGVWLAAIGGGMALMARDRKGANRVWTVLLLGTAGAFLAMCATHGFGWTPWTPWVPTLQKLLIVLFMAWFVAMTRPFADGHARRRSCIVVVLLLLCVSAVVGKELPPQALAVPEEKAIGGAVQAVPLTEDELAALRWLDYVTGPLDAAAEKEWWNVGGSQHGIFARRYHLAFAGYAAATLGLRGTPEQRQVVGRILDNCIKRYLERESWKYSMSKSYWGKKPWAPDPCYRENVMYTGHLLQLLAFYEYFTGDTKYWKQGFDFVWDKDRKVHYDVQKLIDVSVYQMRNGPHGGICCEPGLVFFPCNNHPHVALKLFAKLGHGDWTQDHRRWEKWALAHYRHPAMGGGALNMVYHNRTGIMYPFGHPGLDGWSLLWYEPWAEKRGSALALWQDAAKCLDWSKFEPAVDAVRGTANCADPNDVPCTASASFLAAAARACGDIATAERMERAVDDRMKRENGWLWLDLGREWRVGATALRITSMAIKNGSNWRSVLTTN